MSIPTPFKSALSDPTPLLQTVKTASRHIGLNPLKVPPNEDFVSFSRGGLLSQSNRSLIRFGTSSDLNLAFNLIHEGNLTEFRQHVVPIYSQPKPSPTLS